ncbi:carboxylate-amine ligase [Zunongwangia endophytica]|uniref:Glutamate-cysteine ligase family protein n=1 Tax=Zunongwangia endophytica TaxID=1808945 RepID=A0ABV8HC47_9FLAO|nr:glutamate-cysteine ligase family protein [Zunongwangia endophytica]MDN3594125.1 glutamate-cysteine ligase family protein [Zunongwangia endophytica]
MGYHIFEVYGIELEYMLVNRQLNIVPITDKLFIEKTGKLTSDVENGKIAWSNELVAHVVELKTAVPIADLENLDEVFADNVSEINQLLEGLDAQLLPTAAHPLMNPFKETKLWEHDNNDIYELYNQIFDCSGHGWSNVQSMHINLPFADDVEFEKLHAAIRILLPIIPAISASSPIFEGQLTGFMDSRMEVYKTNQKEIPEMAGKVIPECLYNKEEYHRGIFEPIKQAIKAHDKNGILEHHFLNSRGAIARFDRGAIEIRVIDLQECPKADIAIAVLIIESLKALVNEEFISRKDQKAWKEDDLLAILNEAIKDAERGIIKNKSYLNIFGLEETSEIGEIWKNIYEKVKDNISEKHQQTIEYIIHKGSLSNRIIGGLEGNYSEESIKKVYSDVAKCLANNELYKP